MPEVFRFLDWNVYKDSKRLASIVTDVVKKIPSEYRFEFGNQINRSSFSVALNIAEGSAKHSDRDFNHFMNISLGSLSETVAAADILKDNKIIDEKKFIEIKEISENIARQIGGFKKKLSGKKLIVKS